MTLTLYFYVCWYQPQALLSALNTNASGIFISGTESFIDVDELYYALFGTFLRRQKDLNDGELGDMNTAILRDFTFLSSMACGNDYVPGVIEYVIFPSCQTIVDSLASCD